MTSKQRNSNIELLRLLLMVGIFCWHIIVHGFGFVNIGEKGMNYTLNMPLTLALSSILAPATYTFVFISGYYGIRFKLKKFVELVLWCIIVSLGCTLFKYYIGNADIIDVYRSLFPITNTIWWFMTAYVGLYLLSPFINEGIVNMEKEKFKSSVIIFLIMSAIGTLALGMNLGSNLIGLITVYLLARYLRMYIPLNMKISLKFYAISLLLMFTCLMTIWCVTSHIGNLKAHKLIFYFLSYCNPLIIAMAVCLFHIFYRLPAWSNKIFNQIASPSLFIYLITERLGGGILYRPIALLLKANILKGMGAILLTVISCLAIGSMIQYIVNHIVDMSLSLYRKRR